jgi:hypothetical protein
VNAVGSKLDDVGCRYCFEDEIYMDVKEEPSLYKVGVECDGCGYDYGVIDRIPQSQVGYLDELYEQAEGSVRDLLE